MKIEKIFDMEKVNFRLRMQEIDRRLHKERNRREQKEWDKKHSFLFK